MKSNDNDMDEFERFCKEDSKILKSNHREPKIKLWEAFAIFLMLPAIWAYYLLDKIFNFEAPRGET